MSFRVDGIDHVELFVPDRRAAADWYGHVLGLRVVTEFEHWAADPRGPLMISSDAGRTLVALFEGVPQAGRDVVGLRRIAFRVNGRAFGAFLDRLPALGLTDHRAQPVTRDLVSDHGVAWSIYFCDPWGTLLEVTTYDYASVKQMLG